MDFRVTFDLNDRTILITGSTGGLGRALASALRTKAIIAAGVPHFPLPGFRGP
jgi:NAD(P)-dependent dehydrogenase (short-subunit alcohol dehydrogenase family)